MTHLKYHIKKKVNKLTLSPIDEKTFDVARRACLPSVSDRVVADVKWKKIG